jgi:hypothetical protein
MGLRLSPAPVSERPREDGSGSSDPRTWLTGHRIRTALGSLAQVRDEEYYPVRLGNARTAFLSRMTSLGAGSVWGWPADEPSIFRKFGMLRGVRDVSH